MKRSDSANHAGSFLRRGHHKSTPAQEPSHRDSIVAAHAAACSARSARRRSRGRAILSIAGIALGVALGYGVAPREPRRGERPRGRGARAGRRGRPAGARRARRLRRGSLSAHRAASRRGGCQSGARAGGGTRRQRAHHPGRRHRRGAPGSQPELLEPDRGDSLAAAAAAMVEETGCALQVGAGDGRAAGRRRRRIAARDSPR